MSAEARLHHELDRLQAHLPRWAARLLGWLRRPAATFVRIPLGIVLVIGGFLGFLPILGFWMIPLGLALIAIDVPPIRRPLAWLLSHVTRWLDRRKARRPSAAAPSNRPCSIGRPE